LRLRGRTVLALAAGTPSICREVHPDCLRQLFGDLRWHVAGWAPADQHVGVGRDVERDGADSASRRASACFT